MHSRSKPAATAGAVNSTPAPPARETSRIERNVVVHVVVAATAGSHPARRSRPRRSRRSEIAAALVRSKRATTALAVEHRQRGIEVLQDDFGRIAILAVLVLPFSGLELALDINLGALLQILLGNLAETFTKDHDAMPFRLFFPLAGVLVAPGIRGRNAQIGDRTTVLCALDFRVGAEISNQNDFIDASRHYRSPL